MKRWMNVIAVCLLFLIGAGCQEENGSVLRPSLWLLGGPNIDNESDEITLRAGLQTGDLEFGGESNWVGLHGENQHYLVYAIGYLPPTALGQPYLGYHASIANDQEDGGLYGPIGGTINRIGGLETVVEYQYRNFNGPLEDLLGDENYEHTFYVGAIIRR